MVLTAFLLMLKLMTVFIEPQDPLSKDDQTLATCAAQAMTARPSDLKIVTSKELADVTLTVHNDAKMRIHILGRLTKQDGTVLVDVNHVTHGFNHTLCHQMDGLLDEMVRTYSQKNRQ